MSDWLGLAGKTCVVTGAAGGIGRAVALEFARAGAAVALIDLTADRCAEVKQEVLGLGARCAAFGADISNEDDVTRVADECLGALGSCNVLVNTPAISGRPDSLWNVSFDKWRRQLSVNVSGYLLCAQAFTRQMHDQGGSMVHVGSIAGQFPQPQSGAYSVSKAAVSMMSRVLALELGAKRIRSNVVSPGMVRTPLSERFYSNAHLLKRREEIVPLRMISTPDQVADVIVYLASSRASYVTGQDLLVDGGVSLALMGLFPRPDH
jgi:NAD(P)-dependent dehydrogenase (short-subunit alcohol dehydrogenase family)